MRKTMLAVATSFALSGCAGTLPGIDPSIQTNIDNTIAQVQSITTSACKFLPTAQTVANIIATFTGSQSVVATASAIANSICNAVTAKSVRRGATRPMVRGVVLRGQFVR